MIIGIGISKGYLYYSVFANSFATTTHYFTVILPKFQFIMMNLHFFKNQYQYWFDIYCFNKIYIGIGLILFDKNRYRPGYKLENRYPYIISYIWISKQEFSSRTKLIIPHRIKRWVFTFSAFLAHMLESHILLSIPRYFLDY